MANVNFRRYAVELVDVAIPDTDGAWQELPGSLFECNDFSLLSMSALSDTAGVKLRLAQGQKVGGEFVPFVLSSEVETAAASAPSDGVRIAVGHAWARVEVQSEAAAVGTVLVNGQVLA